MKKLLYIFLLSLLYLPCQAATIEQHQVYSQSMHKELPVLAIIPEGYETSGRNYPVVYMLNGYTGDYTNYFQKVDALPSLVDDLQLIVICTEGNDSWYIDSPNKSNFQYETHVAAEVPAWVDKHYRTVASREGRAITGLSMGGHGAMYLGMRHPDTFGAIGSMSGGLNLTPFSHKWNLKHIIGDYAADPEKWEQYTALHHASLLAEHPYALIIDCGVDDFFIGVNREFHQKLLNLRVPHTYMERPGGHSWPYWNQSVAYHLQFFDEFFNQ